MSLDNYLTKLDVGTFIIMRICFKRFFNLDDTLFDRESFLSEIGKSASREELIGFVEKLKRSSVALKTERISFINDKYPEVIEAIQILTQVKTNVDG